MLVTTALGRSFDDEDQYDYQLRIHTVDGQPPGYLYLLCDDDGLEWAFQPIVDGQRSKLVETIPEGERREWVARNRVWERVYRQVGLPVPAGT